MKKTVLFFVLCTLIIPFAKGQDVKLEKPVQPAYVHNVGGFAGVSGGFGLSYRYFGQKFGIQVATTPIFASDYTYLSFGLTGLYSINKGRITQLYGYLANHYMFLQDKYSDETITDKINITGIGMGVEVVAGERVGFNIQFGYAYYYLSSDDWFTNFDGGAGIFYKF